MNNIEQIIKDNELEVQEYFSKTIVERGIKHNYCFVPTWYGGMELHDFIIEKYTKNNFEPTHFELRWIDFPKDFLVTFLYYEGFGAAITQVSEKQEIKFSMLDTEFEKIQKEKYLTENEQSNG